MGRQHLNQSILAKRLGKAQPWVSRRIGEHADTAIDLDDLEAFAAALNVPATRLLGWADTSGHTGAPRRETYRPTNDEYADDSFLSPSLLAA